jgi:hypothetical protein
MERRTQEAPDATGTSNVSQLPLATGSFHGDPHFIGNSELWLDGPQGVIDSEEGHWKRGPGTEPEECGL